MLDQKYFPLDAHPPKYRGGSPENGQVPLTGTMLSEDYAEIVDEEGDYSTPASKLFLSSFHLQFLVIKANLNIY